jgi:hypothetical protein
MYISAFLGKRTNPERKKESKITHKYSLLLYRNLIVKNQLLVYIYSYEEKRDQGTGFASG